MTDEPIPLAQAAKLLGITKEAARQRLKRGQIEGFRDNHGRWMVVLAEPDRQGLAPLSPRADELTATKIEAAHWRAVAEQLGVRLADRDRELAEVKAERNRLLELVERLADARRSLWQELRERLVRRLRK